MPNVQQKKFNSGALVALGFIVAMVIVMLLKIDLWIRAAIDVALLLLFIFLRRGYMYFYRGAVNFKSGKVEKVWPNMEKALKAGVDFERRTMIGSAFVQQGDAKRGVEILEAVMASPKAGNFRNTATITCSMGYWRLGEQEKAIEVLEDLRATGYRDDNLSINLETYLLERGELKRAKALITESRKDNTENNGLLDNRGWYYIQVGNWAKAKEVYDELIDDRNAKFPEAYLHGAQVSVHDGDISQAIDRLGWGTSKRFSGTCLTRKDYIEHLLLGLENPATRDEFAKAMDAAAVAVSNSKEFEGFAMAKDFEDGSEGVIKPKEKPEYSATTSKTTSSNKDDDLEISESDSNKDINTDVDDDDREPNTDLNEEDYEFAAANGDDDGDEDEYVVLSTDIDDDDDREPNTDLEEDE